MAWGAIRRWCSRLAVPALLAVGAALAVTSLLGDSITFDETSHLTSGVSYLRTGDFRLAPDHPPLSKIWAALPLLWAEHQWPSPLAPGWREGDYWTFGRAWLFELNDGERLVSWPRCMMVVLLLGTCLCIYGVARTLFGPAAGLLALTAAVLSPTLLAHGHLVTTDLPVALCMMLTTLAFVGLLERISIARLLAAAASFSALCLVKFSALLMLPVLALVGANAILRPSPIRLALVPPVRQLARFHQRVIAVICCALLIALVAWVSIWSCFAWRYSPFRGKDHAVATMVQFGRPDQARLSGMGDVWAVLLEQLHQQPHTRAIARSVEWLRRHKLLPEAYLYGFVRTLRGTAGRPAYLCGKYSSAGWPSYFPIAFAIKTPIPILLLLLAGVVALASGRFRLDDRRLLVYGLSVFLIVYGFSSILSHINIGHRHILPIYPVVMVFVGASAAWLKTRLGRWLVPAAMLWLLVANLRIHPHYLCYFNELVGGPKNGHLYLADSNIDWGQDLKRLAAYAREHPGESIKLAYFGSADPTRYGFACQALPSVLPFEPSAELTAGTYVVSVTMLLGVYDPQIRDSFGDPLTLSEYRHQHRTATRATRENEPAWRRERPSRARQAYEALRRKRLLNQLRHREPDGRIGYSLFVYHLSQDDVDELTKP
jgi:hypothetical protein